MLVHQGVDILAVVTVRVVFYLQLCTDVVPITLITICLEKSSFLSPFVDLLCLFTLRIIYPCIA